MHICMYVYVYLYIYVYVYLSIYVYVYLYIISCRTSLLFCPTDFFQIVFRAGDFRPFVLESQGHCLSPAAQ